MAAKKPAPIVIKMQADGLKGVQSAFASIGKSASALKRTVDTIGQSLSKIGKTGAGAVAAIGGAKAALAAFTKAGVASVGEQARFAKQVGLTNEQYQELRYSAERAGVEVDSLNGFLINLADKSIDAAIGNEESAKQLADLGISAVDAAGNIKPMSRLIADLSDSIASMPDGTAKTGLLSIFAGDDGARAIGFLNLGSAGLRRQAEEARALGNILPDSYAKIAKGASDASKQLKFTVTSIRDELAMMFAPGYEASARKTTQFLQKYRKDIVQIIDQMRLYVGRSIDELIAVFWRGEAPTIPWIADLKALFEGGDADQMQTGVFKFIASLKAIPDVLGSISGAVELVKLAYRDFTSIAAGGDAQIELLQRNADIIRDVIALLSGDTGAIKSEWLSTAVDGFARVADAAGIAVGVIADVINIIATLGSEAAYTPITEFGARLQDFVRDIVGIFGALSDGSTYEPVTMLGKQIKGGSPGHAARPRPRPWLGTPLRPVKRMALRGGTGGSLDGRGALARPGPRMRAAFGLTEPPASVIAAPARGSRNLLRPELSSPPRPRGRGRALQATSWTRHPTAKDSEATCGKVWPRKRPREPREDRHPKGRDLRAERTMPPRRSAGSERDGGRRTWGAGTGGAQSSGSGPVQPAHE
ncbi:hypothetical protein [Cereibacter azotoformans]|uniref:Phage tail tape measure protein n=1 Tax=Cereibacter azotoformans TaxID=43057 RepID=A0A2T5K766_9RHOB|nr:hypothetical protein [Cereibacter azotoformans]MBO4169552.1 hypothetical protein [Cereibacter azotoformans]PTR18229.1 hypothetical protein C8J28_109189 [Cereibacter azotoformans]